MIKALTAMLEKPVVSFDCQETPLDGGTIGDVRLLSGEAATDTNERIPFKMVYKTHKKFERPGDAGSWRREYDLYASDLGAAFTGAFRWPKCYRAQIDDAKFEIWMEYIDAPSGAALDIHMLEKAALEIGRWQGRIYADSALAQRIRSIKNLGDPGFLRRNFSQWHSQNMTYEFIISKDCRLSEPLKTYYKENKDRIDHTKTIEYNILRSELCDLPRHLKQMLFDVDARQNDIFAAFERLPVVFCQRDYWIENIFYDDGNIVAIDWDTAGWGYLGEDIAQLIFDDIDVEHFNEYAQRLIPAYYQGFGQLADIPQADIQNSKAAIRDFILVVYGYRTAQRHMFSGNAQVKAQAEKELQNVFDLQR